MEGEGGEETEEQEDKHLYSFFFKKDAGIPRKKILNSKNYWWSWSAPVVENIFTQVQFLGTFMVLYTSTASNILLFTAFI